VASGSTPAPWKVWYGTAGHGAWTCFAPDPSDLQALASAPKVGGRAAWCEASPGLDSDVRLFGGPLGTPEVVMGMARNGAHAVVLHLTDGSKVPMTLRANGTFGWYGNGTLKSISWVDGSGRGQTCAGKVLAASVVGGASSGPPQTAPTSELSYWPCVVGQVRADSAIPTAP
jgi:hypothetical protein